MTFRAALALLGALALGPVTSAAGTPSYLCGPAKVRQAERASTSVVLTDRLDAPREATLGRIQTACWAEAPATDRLATFAARTTRKARRVGAAASLVTRFGTEQVVVKAFTGVAAGSGEGTPRTCYSVRGKRPGGGRVRVVFGEAGGERVVDVGRPTRLCLPTGGDDAPEILCHAARPVRSARGRAGTMTIDTAFGPADLRVGAPRELCVPVLVSEPPPPPGLTLRVTPSAVTLLVGDQPALEATARFADGHEESWTHRTRFTSSDETVVAGTSVAGAFVEGVGLGTAVITAVDVVTGVTSSGAGNASLTVEWPLERLVITPHQTTKVRGGWVNYTVRGFFAGGLDTNLTQRVVYASSDATIASAPNAAPTRSRVLALGPGTVTISATDPISGISTTDSGDDATLHVSAKLIGVGVESGLRYSSLFPGQVRRWTATGYYDDGTTKNFTQKCTWWSTDPSVAVAPNDPGDLSRIEAVAPGHTTIGCTSWEGGFTSWATPFWVLGELIAIDVSDNTAPADWMPEGGSVRLTAVGSYEGGGFHNLSHDVEWTSLDPSIAVAPNEPGDRSRIDAVGPGDAVIRATDPTTGLFDDATVVSVGKLVSLQVIPLWGLKVIPVGVTRRAEVRGIFEHRYLNLTNREPGSFTLQSSDPAILEVLDDRRVLGVGTGVVDLTATNGVLTSPPVQVTVQGSVQSPSVTLSMTPAAATRGIGEFESFTVTAFFPPGNYDNFTPYVQFASSDHSVAVPSGIPGWPSRFDTVGPGTATITATHVASGKTATSTLTVLPGAIERVTIEPASAVRNPMNGFSFTAIGHYPGGATVNVTQVCTWISLTPDVATAPNAAGDRSRIVAGTTAGDATIVAVHPSGVSSHDTGDDATFTTKELASITLTPEAHIGSVGMVERYTLVGTFDDQTTINLTQDARYWTDDVTVAVADEYEGDRSAVRMVAPGETMVHAAFADWTRGGAQASGSVAGAFLRVVP